MNKKPKRNRDATAPEKSPKKRYVDPGEQAFEMFEEALRPYVDEFKKYLELSMDDEAKSYCMGILKGLYRAHKESNNEVIDYVADAPSNSFSEMLDEWKAGNKGPEKVNEMEEFMKDNLHDWYQKK